MNVALIMAAGIGSRINSDIPKQFIEVNGQSILWWTLKKFNDSPNIDAIYVVTSKSYFNKVDEISYEFEKVLGCIEGGKTRQDSVYNGIKFLSKNGFIDSDIVLIHDAARPLVDEEIIKNNIVLSLESGAAVTSIPANDSIVRSLDGKNILNSENRKEIYQNQTPQTFKLEILKSAYDKLVSELGNYTDDCQIVMKAGYKVNIVEGSKLNFKITTNADLELFECLMSKK